MRRRQIPILPLLALAIAAAPATAAKEAKAKPELPAGFVRLADIDPTIRQDMRYAGPWNFTGRVVPGYNTGTCILAAPIASALKRVQQSLRPEGLSLKVYDCYRPERAVRAFMRWGSRRGDDPQTKYFHPRIARERIIPQGYIARRSSHSRGTAIDLTIVKLEAGKAGIAKAAADLGPGTNCIDDKDRRRRDDSLDMGTSWDCFDVLSHTYNPRIPAAARTNRDRLLRAMAAQGFRNYRREWWHFWIDLEQFTRHRDFPVE